MRYSVWNYDTRAWDYYEGAGLAASAGAFREPVGEGHAPEEVLVSLPGQSVYLGSGPVCVGTPARGPRSASLVSAGLGETGPLLVRTQSAGAGAGVLLSWLGLGLVVGGSFWLGRKSTQWSPKAALRRLVS